MAFVVDASIVVAWAIEDESSEAGDRLLARARQEGAVSPSLLWYEVRNTLVVAERRKRIAAQVSDEFLERLEKLPMQTVGAPDSRRTMHLARHHALSAYDAAYLEFAIRNNLALATFDQRLAHAARAEGVTVLSG